MGREPGRPVINAGAFAEDRCGRGRSWGGGGGRGGSVGGSGDLGGGWSSGGCVQGNREGVVELSGQENKSCCIQEAVNSLDERPAEDGVHSNVFAQSNVDAEWAIVRVEVGQVVGDDGTEEAGLDGLGDLRRVGMRDSSSEADGVKGLSGVVELSEADNTVRVLCSKGFVVGVEATVEAGASVEKGGQGGCCGGKGMLAKG